MPRNITTFSNIAAGIIAALVVASPASAETKGLIDIPSEFCPSHFRLAIRNIEVMLGGFWDPLTCRSTTSEYVSIAQSMLENGRNRSCYSSKWNSSEVINFYEKQLRSSQATQRECEQIIQKYNADNVAAAEEKRRSAEKAAAEKQEKLRKQRQAEADKEAQLQKQRQAETAKPIPAPPPVKNEKPGAQGGNPMSCFKLASRAMVGSVQWFYKVENKCPYGVMYMLNVCERESSEVGSNVVCKNTKPETIGRENDTFSSYSIGEPQLIKACNVNTLECHTPTPQPRQ